MRQNPNTMASRGRGVSCVQRGRHGTCPHWPTLLIKCLIYGPRPSVQRHRQQSQCRRHQPLPPLRDGNRATDATARSCGAHVPALALLRPRPQRAAAPATAASDSVHNASTAPVYRRAARRRYTVCLPHPHRRPLARPMSPRPPMLGCPRCSMSTPYVRRGRGLGRWTGPP